MNNIPRDIRRVIINIQLHIPEIEIPFYAALNRIKNESYLKSPETMYLSWVELTNLIASKFKNHPTQEWHFRILSVFSTIPIDRIEKAFSKE
jgi:hypothetical protein